MISLTRASPCPHTALVEDSDRSRAWLGKLSHAYSSLKESYARNACYFAAGDFLTSREAREIIEQEGIVLLSYKPLQKVWQERCSSTT